LVLFAAEPTVPDLAISNLVVDPSSAEPGEKVRIYFKVENLGIGTAEEVTISAYAYLEVGKIAVHTSKIGNIKNWQHQKLATSITSQKSAKKTTG